MAVGQAKSTKERKNKETHESPRNSHRFKDSRTEREKVKMKKERQVRKERRERERRNAIVPS